jgi:hypothetical protein
LNFISINTRAGHTHEKAECTATNMMGAILIFRGVNFPDDHLLCMRILVESIPRRLEDVLIREGQPSKCL